MTIHLVEDQWGPDARDNGVKQRGGHILPLPPLLKGLGGALWHQEPGEEVGAGEGDKSQQDEEPVVQPAPLDLQLLLLLFPDLHGSPALSH